MNASLKGSISAAISQANDKAAQKAEGSFTEQVAKDQVASAQNRISVLEGKMTRDEGELAKATQEFNNPGTKEKTTGSGKEQKTMEVENEEAKKLAANRMQEANQRIAQTKSEVEKAKEDAQAASSKAIAQAGINAETQSEMDRLTAKAGNIKETLSEGGKVDDKEIKELVDSFTKVSNELTADQNKAGILTNSFYAPMAETLEDISDLLDGNNTNSSNEAQVAQSSQATETAESETSESDAASEEEGVKETAGSSS